MVFSSKREITSTVNNLSFKFTCGFTCANSQMQQSTKVSLVRCSFDVVANYINILFLQYYLPIQVLYISIYLCNIHNNYCNKHHMNTTQKKRKM